MIARLDNLRKHAVFVPLTGLTVAVFDALAAEPVPAIEAIGGPLDGAVFMDSRDVHAWLETIDPGELTPEGREVLAEMKRHFARVEQSENRVE